MERVVVAEMKKEEIRREIWALLEERKVSRFPFPTVGRIPNFEGARQASRQLTSLDCWQDARSLKANPDSPQRSARRLALSEGKTVYMAVPRLTQRSCFLELDPRAIATPERAATIKGAFALGRPVRPDRIGTLDLVLAGSVAVDYEGGRLGKGGGYSDLEYALGREYGFLEERTPVVTTVHPLQLIREGIPMSVHDISVDFVVTPKEAHRMKPHHPKPQGIRWDILQEEMLNRIPILLEIRRRTNEGHRKQ
ncbi:MAG: 5-formyltetrahydrofolate cyclo-ligase [Thermoplasmata archaeon]